MEEKQYRVLTSLLKSGLDKTNGVRDFFLPHKTLGDSSTG